MALLEAPRTGFEYVTYRLRDSVSYLLRDFIWGKMSTYNLILGDSSEQIKNIPDLSIDLILTDPPYNLGRYSTGNIKMSWRKDFNNYVAE